MNEDEEKEGKEGEEHFVACHTLAFAGECEVKTKQKREAVVELKI